MAVVREWLVLVLLPRRRDFELGSHRPQTSQIQSQADLIRLRPEVLRISIERTLRPSHPRSLSAIRR